MKRSTRIGIAVASTLAFVAFGTLNGSVASSQDGAPQADAPAGDTKALITNNVENTYVPVTPCRIVDGREALGVIPAGGNRSYEVRGTTGFVPQGGTSGGCGIPTYATAVTFTVTVVNPEGSGFLRGWPQGQGEPNATLMNWVDGVSQSTTAPLTLGAATEAKDIRFKAYGNDAMLVIDVQGFYAPQIQAVIGLDGSLGDHTSRVVSSSRPATGQYTVTVDRNVSGCVASANANGSGPFIANAVPGAGNTVTVYTYRTNTGDPTNITFLLDITC
ncbi:hypothetical protein ACE2AJ_19820 [Aquihabitans daechungensis]|uniref:hypothetical protein n=1 Tax=Aquihabitans daechungensis TaxID=1052257 RepID=UPI003B9FDAF0